MQEKGGDQMIRYDRLWKTMKEKGISQYDLIYKYGVDKAQLQRLRKNMVLKTITLDRLCEICLLYTSDAADE